MALMAFVRLSPIYRARNFTCLVTKVGMLHVDGKCFAKLLGLFDLPILPANTSHPGHYIYHVHIYRLLNLPIFRSNSARR
jgi:hypothetical protein